MQRKGNPNALLVGMQTSEVTVENSMEFPQKTTNGTPFDLAISLLGLYPKNPETPIQKTYAPDVHSSKIYNSQVLEATYVPISK